MGVGRCCVRALSYALAVVLLTVYALLAIPILLYYFTHYSLAAPCLYQHWALSTPPHPVSHMASEKFADRPGTASILCPAVAVLYANSDLVLPRENQDGNGTVRWMMSMSLQALASADLQPMIPMVELGGRGPTGSILDC